MGCNIDLIFVAVDVGSHIPDLIGAGAGLFVQNKAIQSAVKEHFANGHKKNRS